MKPKYLKIAIAGFATVMTLNSCQEQIDEGARFTFVGNTIATYLQGEEDCSHFVDILTRGECIGLMKAYGQYTCFAPTNEAVERFLIEQDSIYHESVRKYEETKGTPNETKIIDTGVYSPYLSELSAKKCSEIARNHILPKMYLGIDLIGNQIPDANMNDRDLTLDFDTIGGKSVAMINSTARVKWEEEVENGAVHVLDGVINPSSLNVPTLMDEYNYFGIFMKALNQTGYADLLVQTEDANYTEGDKIVQSIREKELAPYPVARRMRFTVFLETNEVLAKYGITDEASLLAKCKEWYPEDMKVWDWTGDTIDNVDFSRPLNDWRNPVNQFVGYHILDRKVAYENLVCYNVKAKGKGEFDSEKDFPGNADRTEYYVTMNNRILKVTMPRSESGSERSKIYLNYAPEGKGQNIMVYSSNEFRKLNEELYEAFNPEALNGSLNVIEDILVYDEDIMKGHVLNCIMRFDCSSICSELTNNRIRWKYTSMLTQDGAVFIPHNYCNRVKVYSEDTRLFYLAPHTVWHNYQGDEMMALGLFDFAYRLPPIPEGTYEIRMGYSASSLRHVVQVYLDNEVTGLPIDLRLTGDKPQVNWVADKDLADEEAIAAKDKEMKNRGYLKGPSTFRDDTESGLARDNSLNLRSVIATKYLTAGSHWLRFKNVLDTDNGSAQFMHDYFEIVPVSYLRDESISVEDKRK